LASRPRVDLGCAMPDRNNKVLARAGHLSSDPIATVGQIGW
jgi:hypothetical protein